MPAPSVFDTMPAVLREELEAKLIAQGFGGYTELTEWLNQNGYQISRATVGNFGKEFKERHQSLKLMRQMAIAYRQELPEGGEEAVQDTLLEVGKALTLEFAFMVQNALSKQEGLYELKLLTPFVGTATRAIESINRSDVAVAKYADEVKNKVAALDGKPGIDQETLDRVRREIFGN